MSEDVPAPAAVPNWEDILDLHVIKKLTQIINRRWRLGVGFASADGLWVRPPSIADGALCEAVQQRKAGLLACEKAGTQAVKQLASAHERGERLHAISYSCHAGLRELAVPIVCDGELAGAMLVGGFVHEGNARPELAEIERRAATSPVGLPVADVQRIGARQPVLSEGDLDYLTELMELCAEEIVTFQAELSRRERQLVMLQRELNTRYSYEAIIGKSRPMQEIFRLLDKVIDSDSTVLISGENGTGKELIAKAIHHNSPRKTRRFVIQNCSAFNDNLLDSELFGHKKGSFTGAIADKQGLFEVADGGTFFLDEIGDMSPALQVKLLRVLQEGTFIPVGDTQSKQVDVRIIAASNKDLKRMVERGEFREDLYYRVNVINLTLPSLRDRRDDIPLLVEFFLKKNAKGRRLQMKRLTKACLDRLMDYPWPGNVRELENEIERLVVLAGDDKLIGDELLSQRIKEQAARDGSAAASASSLPDTVKTLERQMIYEVLKKNQWNKTKAAMELNISRRNLIRKVAKYNLRKGHTPRA